MSLTLTLKDNGGNPVSGEGTSITLNNTTETNFTKFDLYGDTEQTTYSGKNLFDKNAITANKIVSRETGTTSTTDNYSASDYIPVEEGQQYTFTNGFNRWYSAYYDSSKQYVGYPTNTQVITIPTGARYIRLSVYNSLLDTAQFEKGSSATSFEPYVGGTASPNPDYPQEVQTVTGEQTITVSNGQGGSQVYPINLGKNLLRNLQGAYINATDNGITNTLNEDGSLTCSGTVGSSWNGWTISNYVDNNLPTGTYTFSIDQTIGYTINVTFRDSSNTNITAASISSGSKSATVTLDRPAAKLSFWVNATIGSSVNFTIKPMVEKGSTATTYAPYIQAFGKNLLNPNTFVKGRVDNGAIGYTSDTSDLSANDTTISFTTTATYRGVASALIPVKPNTTYTSSVGSSTAGMGTYADFYDATGTWISRSSSGITISTPATCAFIRVSYQLASAGTGTITNPMVEESSSATTYEPNMSGQLELCEIGDYQDYLYKSEGNWYVHKETWNYTFDGSSDEQWIRSGQSTSTNFVAGMVNLQNFAMIGGGADSGYCNYFDFATALADNKVILSGYQSGGYRFLLYRFPSGSTVTDLTSFTTWLGNHHLKMVLVLSTAADYKITYEPLVAQLDALYNTAHSYSGQTIVTSSSQYLPAIMDVTVGASTNEVTYTETELSNPLTITDIEGKSQNTTLNGNIYVDYVYNKKSFSVSIFNLKSADYATIRGFYDRQFTLNEFPLLSIPELNISEMPVFFEIGSREINSQCIVTDKLTLKFRETAQQ